ncbi:hypothetical protein [Acinetobacter baumannii]|uniref:hypothetical protein n=1 Tax=Acinetobacter baumannii TaxID=470 RepID=UPI003A8B371E
MDNYKIKVKDEAESKEAQELFFELGYSWLCCGKYYNRIGNYTFITAYPDEMLLRMGWGGDTDKELPLPQLRDLVVLKRNDINDANYRSKRVSDGRYFKSCDGIFYFMFEGKWVQSEVNTDEGLEPITQDPALISGADVPALIKKGESVQFRSVFNVQGGGEWEDLDLERDEEEFSLGDLINTRFEWRLKPQTIKVELELPKPFEPKDGEVYYYLKPSNAWGFGCGEWGDDSMQNEYIQYGAWPTKEDVLKVVEQLRKIRGTNS